MSPSLEYVGIAGLLYLAVFTVVVPLVAVRAARRFRTRPLPPPTAVFRSVLIQQALILGVSVLVARQEWVPLYVAPDRWWLALGLAVVATTGLVALMRPTWRHAVERGDPRVQLLAPRTGRERGLWVAVSIAAGVAEEVAYRGVLWVLLERWIGSPVIAAGLASVAFGLAHALQGGRGIVVVSLIALGMHALVRATGSLLAPILVHIAYDLVAGFSYAALQRRHGAVAAGPDWPSPG